MQDNEYNNYSLTQLYCPIFGFQINSDFFKPQNFEVIILPEPPRMGGPASNFVPNSVGMTKLSIAKPTALNRRLMHCNNTRRNDQ